MIDNDRKLLLKVMSRQAKINKTFPYSLLAIVLPEKQLLEFISVFGGTTFTVPTLKQLAILTRVCAIYEMGGYEKAEKLGKGVTKGVNRETYDRYVAKFNS
jgi:hypothetical protein